MTASARPAVVVGFDHSPQAAEAVQVAAEEAARRHRRLHLVHAISVRPYEEIFPEGAVPVDSAPWRQAAEQQLSELAERLRASWPELDITTCVRTSSPTVLLLQEARNADLLVVGARGDGGFPALTIGSVGAQVAAHAVCPVLIARPGAGRSDPVVVGVDGSASCERAIAFAYEEADARGVPLTALHTYLPWAHDPASQVAAEVADAVDGAAEEALVSESLAGWREKYPDVETRIVVRRQHPATGLVEAGAGAQLLVVGSRGLGGFRGLLLGSVSRSVLHHATCSVAIVRGPLHPADH